MGKLMHDFLCSDPDDMHFDILAERSRYFKENPKGVSEMCKAMEEICVMKLWREGALRGVQKDA